MTAIIIRYSQSSQPTRFDVMLVTTIRPPGTTSWSCVDPSSLVITLSVHSSPQLGRSSVQPRFGNVYFIAEAPRSFTSKTAATAMAPSHAVLRIGDQDRTETLQNVGRS